MTENDLILTQNINVGGIEYVSRIVNMQQGALLSADSLQVPTIVTPGNDGDLLVRNDAAVDGTGLEWRLITDLFLTPLKVSAGGTGNDTFTAGCLVFAGTTAKLESTTYVKYQNSSLRVYRGTDYLTLGGLGATAESASIYYYGGDYKNIIIGANVSDGGVFVNKAVDRVGIFKGNPSYTLDVNGSFRASGATYIEDIKPVSGTSFVSVDSTGKLGTGTPSEPSHEVEYAWVGDIQVLNHTTAPGLIHRQTITNNEYDAGASSVTWRWTVDGYRALDSTYGHGKFTVYLKFNALVYVFNLEVNADNQEEYFSIRLLLSPIDADYSIATMEIILGGDRSVTSRIGRGSTNYNNKVFHGTVDNLELWIEEGEDDSQIYKNRILIEKITA